MAGARKPKADVKRAESELRAFALGYPAVHEDFPWGHSAFKVQKKKVFLFMAAEGGGLSLSVKLPQSGVVALMLPFAEPTHYGLGKSGWVTATFKKSEAPPLPLLRQWIDESYRSIAPKKLLAQLAESPAAAAAVKKPATPRKRKA